MNKSEMKSMTLMGVFGSIFRCENRFGGEFICLKAKGVGLPVNWTIGG